MDTTTLRVRDRHLVRLAVDHAYRGSRTAASLPPREAAVALVESAWLCRASSEREAWGGISKAVSRLVGLFKRAPQAWEAIKQGLGIESESLPDLIRKMRDLMAEGKNALAKVIHGLSKQFPLSLFFVEHSKMPGLTAMLSKLMKDIPWIAKALSKIHGGAEVLDHWFKKYIPTLRRPVYAAIFIYIWISVFELTWDLKDLIAGFTGGISLSQLLASLPESAIGALVSQFGFGTFAALPATLMLRIAWLVAQHYLEYRPGKGFVVHWDRLGLQGHPELVPA